MIFLQQNPFIITMGIEVSGIFFGLLGVKMGRVDHENIHHILDTSQIRLQHFFELVKNKKSIQKLKFEIS